MELLELFLHQKGKYDNKISIGRGMSFVQRELLQRLKGYKKYERPEYFFDSLNEPTADFYELMDFWEICEEYIDIFDQKEKSAFWVLCMINKVDSLYYTFEYDRFVAKNGEEFAEEIHKLTHKIESIQNMKCIKMFDFDMVEICENSLNEFSEDAIGSEYAIIKYRLAQVMIDGGIVVVVEDSDGVIKNQFHGFKLGKNVWEEYPSENLEPYRDVLLASNPEAVERGKLRGVVKWKATPS